MSRLLMLLGLVLVSSGLWLVGDASGGGDSPRSFSVEKNVNDPWLGDTTLMSGVIVRPLARSLAAPAWVDRCERLRFDPSANRVRRVRRRFTNADRRATREWLGTAAAEFEPRSAKDLARFLWAVASRESSYRGESVHVLSPDIEAAQRAARRVVDSGHAFAGARVKIWVEVDASGEIVIGAAGDGRLVVAWSDGAWSYTRGLFGQVTGLWLRSGGRWGADVPPWALCDARVAVALYVWAARAVVDECARLGHPRTWRTVNRRLSTGHCRERPASVRGKKERAWTKRARDQGLDPDGLVSLDGRRWPESTADRAKLLGRLRELPGYGSR